jgi:hypothetical protein
MSEHIEGVVLHALKKLLKGSTILSLSADKVTAIDMTWISVHVHIMEGWERVPHLMYILYVLEPGSTDHLTERIRLALMHEGNLTRKEIACKLVCFGANGMSTFQGHKTGVITQIHEKYAPFSIGIHYFSHKMNLLSGQYPSCSLCMVTSAEVTSVILSFKSLLISWKLKKTKLSRMSQLVGFQ